MAVRKGGQRDQPKASETTSDPIEQRVVAFAEQLGTLVGTVQARAEGWLDPEALSKEIGRIRDSAADLLDQVNRARLSQLKRVAKQTAPATRVSRGPVDAPGKRHRKPTPQEPIDRMMGEPMGKQMGQKTLKHGKRGGRG